MDIDGAVALVTGANRGLGEGIAHELASRGAAKVYITGRNHAAINEVASTSDRFEALVIDVTKPSQIVGAAHAASDVTIVVNNAGIMSAGNPLSGDLDAYRRDYETNVLGPVTMAQAFTPVIEANGGGAIANVITIIALAPMVVAAPFCASKAALHSWTQAVRPALAGKNISVHGFYPAGIDTDMLASMGGVPKEPIADAAKAFIDGIERGVEMIPSNLSKQPLEVYASDPQKLEAMLTR